MKILRLFITLMILSVKSAFSDDAADEKRVFQQKAIGEMTAEEEETYLKTIGGDHDPDISPKGSKKAPWEHTEHQYGFLPFNSGGTSEQPIVPAHAVSPNTNLTRIDIRLDRLRVFDYPGTGRHFVLFTFAAQNSPTNSAISTESITFSQTYEVQEGEGAGINGYPVFYGLNIGKDGASFKVATINVKNEKDEKALSFLRSGPVSQGLTLLTTAYPATAPFTELTKGIGEMLLTRNENVKVQDFYLGLDLTPGAGFGARLEEGNYIVVQAAENEFTWSDWVYRPADGKIVNKKTSTAIPFNFIIFRVSKHLD